MRVKSRELSPNPGMNARQSVDRADLFALHFDRERRAGIDGAAVDDHRAGTAGAAIAHPLVAGEIGAVADGIEQRHTRFDPEIHALAVDHQRHRHFTGSNRARSALGAARHQSTTGTSGEKRPSTVACKSSDAGPCATSVICS